MCCPRLLAPLALSHKSCLFSAAPRPSSRHTATRPSPRPPVRIHVGDVSGAPSTAPAGLLPGLPTSGSGGQATAVDSSATEARRLEGTGASSSTGAPSGTLPGFVPRPSDAWRPPAAPFNHQDGVGGSQPAGTDPRNATQPQAAARGAAGESGWPGGIGTEDATALRWGKADGTIQEPERSPAGHTGPPTSRENEHVPSRAGHTASTSADGVAGPRLVGGPRMVSFSKTYPGEFILAQLLFWHRNTPRFDPVAALGEGLPGTCLLPDPESVTQPAVSRERDTWLLGMKKDPGAAWPSQWKFKEAVLQVKRSESVGCLLKNKWRCAGCISKESATLFKM